MELEARRASSADANAVLEILDEAAAWLRARGVQQWPVRFERDWIMSSIEAGETWLFSHPGCADLVATVTLDYNDPLWSDQPALAGYLHRLAIRREVAGVGGQVIDWGATQALLAGCEFLRLDCVASNRELCAYYERRGFASVGLAVVGGAPGQRTAGGSTTTVAKYQRSIK